MNGSFDTFRLVNTYGAFGSVGQARFEPIMSISQNGSEWVELELPCKPGKVNRRPCFSAPYHYRIDWNIWFIGFPPHSSYLNRRETWLYNLVEKILDQHQKNRPWLDLLDVETASFLKEEYYDSGNAPRFAKVDMYRYKMAAPLWSLLREGLTRKEKLIWWHRKYKESLIPPVRLNQSTKRLTAANN
mmetsp:Transcript_34837/g.53416  ORF Transcript_34837/g.53416 Transcript_34837/m.53416 type:complete len:187 (+) Transcript_34837:93-653(+)